VTTLDERGRETWRTLMATQTPFISKLGLELIEEGRVKGVEEGRVRGVEEGRVRGVEEGRCAGLREALHRILSARHIELTQTQMGIVGTCTDAALLDEWIVRAVAATDADGVFRSA
jgi:hypothetical protein